MKIRSAAGRTLILLAAMVTGLSPAGRAAAQQAQFHLTALKLNGLSRYSETQTASAGGLKLGDQMGLAQLQAAADRLSQSGAFDKLSYRYTTQGDNLAAEFQVTETTKSDDLTKLMGMKPQEVANQDKIDAGMNAVATAYSKQGYIDGVIKSKVTLTDATRLAAYDVEVNEGIRYHMGQVHFQGVPEKVSAEFAKKWQLQPGQIYHGTYALEFLKKNVAPKLADIKMALPSLSVQRDNAHATADVLFSFQ